MIKIITGKRNSGKTQYLKEHLDQLYPCGGVLSLKRFKGEAFMGYDLYHVSSGQTHPYIVYERDLPKSERPFCKLGDFVFLSGAIEEGHHILEGALKCGSHIIIDEIAQLELAEQVFYDVVKKAVTIQEACEAGGQKALWDLYLVVREGLVDKVIEKFGITTFQLIRIKGGDVVYDEKGA